MTEYVMFGHSPLFGDIVDIIHSVGGTLKSVVQNIPEQVRPGTRPLADLLAQHDRAFVDQGTARAIELQQLADFRPEAGERYLIGFRSHRLIPLRAQLINQWHITFPPLIHSTAVVSPTCKVGEGAIIAAGAIVGAGSSIGRFALLNRGSTVGHDCAIEDFANIGPGANLASFVTVRRCATIGIGATLINWVDIGAHAVIGGGSVVLDNVQPHTLAVGVPAKAKKQVNLNPGRDALDQESVSGE